MTLPRATQGRPPIQRSATVNSKLRKRLNNRPTAVLPELNVEVSIANDAIPTTKLDYPD